MEMYVFMGLEADRGRCLVSAPAPAPAPASTNCPFEL